MKLFSKLNSNEYNNQLEKILENKTFDESVKNLLLSMLYKLNNKFFTLSSNVLFSNIFSNWLLYSFELSFENIRIFLLYLSNIPITLY